MPGFDRSGPMGMGPGTGGGRGFCRPGGFRGSGGTGWLGRRAGRGRGFFGLGSGRWFSSPWSQRPAPYEPNGPIREPETAWLKRGAGSLESLLHSIEQRLSELEKRQKNQERS